MRHGRRLWLKLAAAGGVASAVGLPAWSQAYPTGPVKVVVPSPPGGMNDLLARLVATRLGEAWQQSFVVENRAGGNGLIGVSAVSRARPDGRTLLLSFPTPLAVNLTQAADGIADLQTLAPITLVAETQFAFVVHADVPATTLDGFFAYARGQGSGIRHAISAPGSFPHFLTVQLRQRGGLQSVLVPYQGSGPAIKDLLGGHTTGHVDSLGAVVQHVQAGKLRALAVTSPQRSPLLPDVPTTAELGHADITAASWFTLAAPAGTPAAIVERLRGEVETIARSESYREALHKVGAVPRWSTPEQTLAHIVAERGKWARYLRENPLQAG